MALDTIGGPLQLAADERARKAPAAMDMGDPVVDVAKPGFSDDELLDLWKDIKAETIDNQWVFHRQWQRNIWYILGRQWIEFQAKFGGWRDKRMAAWIPRPVTNKCKETVQAIRAMFTSIALSVNIRPNGAKPENVSSAATADELVPLLHEAHDMNTVMAEGDFWLCSLGNTFLHSFVDYDMKHGETVIPHEECVDCGLVTPSDTLAGATPVCPGCGGSQFIPAMDGETGAPIETREPKGKPTTITLSGLELSFPNSYTRFKDVPYVVRSRWRTKRYYQSQDSTKDLVDKIVWQKAPSDQSLALFTGLAQMNDLGISSGYGLEGSGRGNQHEDGIAEYECWMKPCSDYPDGLVFRIIDAGSPMVIHLEDTEGLPGPLPYRDAEGKPLFTFAHSTFEQVGGRILGSGPIDQIIQKQDQLNQLDSHTLLCLSRTANPVWLEPKGAEIQKLTGMPGLVIKYNALTLGPNVKPERIPGVPIDASVMALREQLLRDIEDLAGTFDIIKGMKPAGVEAFSALQLLVERSQARFSSVFQSRGDMYKEWAGFALELERQYGPEERTKAVMTPARSWTFKSFMRANLKGGVSVVVEDGSTTPKTSLGMRAAVEHANTLGMLNMSDPDQQYEGLKLFGLTRMVPTLDIHMQAALQKQDAFQKWVVNKQAVLQAVTIAQEQQKVYEVQLQSWQATTSQQLAGSTDPSSALPAPLPMPPPPPSPLDGTPLKWQPWYSAQIHLQEFLKWANDDAVRELLTTVPETEDFLRMHMQEIIAAMPGATEQGPVAPPAGGAGMAMANSNQNAGAAPGVKPPPHVGGGGAKPAPVAGKQSPPKS